MADLLTQVSSGIVLGTDSSGDIATDIQKLMKQIAQVEKSIKNLINDGSVAPNDKIKQLKLLQGTLTLLYQALTQLMELQTKQKENQTNIIEKIPAQTAAQKNNGSAIIPDTNIDTFA
ncbi:FlxA-like family protein [Solimicrobium silvestre]|uniref:FlxA-like protein n=1 Tax=Solimicrobium silvestre TaxID=2099400 RepID=A0A2S9GVW9_9BURK|nr:FlxA-like family protein [Solimicrobium silvestre]PRC91869.1 FlxA-like protein [Solimicrobium silvestre]